MDVLDEIEVDILKTPTILERVAIILFFLIIWILGIWMVYEIANYFDWNAKLIGRLFFVPYGFVLFYIEKEYDKIVRGRITGKMVINNKSVMITSKENQKILFDELKMMWLNYGIDTIPSGDGGTYLFKHYETIKIKFIFSDDKILDFHINNHANTKELLVVSNFIEGIKNHHQFFKIHFHNKKKFNKNEYLKTLKRFKIMKSSLKNRVNRKNK